MSPPKSELCVRVLHLAASYLSGCLSDDGAALVGYIVRLHVMLTIRIGYSSVSTFFFINSIKMNDLLVYGCTRSKSFIHNAKYLTVQ